MKTTLQNYSVWFLVAFLAGACLFGTGTVRACSTPVFRYAMYNWAPGPYEVYYFQHGEPSQEDAEVIKFLTKFRDSEDAETPNVMIAKIDPNNKEYMDRLAPWVKKAWESHAKTDGEKSGEKKITEPLFLVMTPWGAELFAGRLDVATAKSMLDSPVRRKIGKLLHAGNAAVLLVLTPPDAEKKAKQANKLTKKIIAQVAPKKQDKKALADQNRDDDMMPPVKMARITLSSKDPAEKWLVRMLMLSEQDLEKEAAEPMVFPIFGRGRALPPLVGEGITSDNLMECVAYISGPCSCQIKDQNIGGDLLMTWSWDATADKLAQEAPADEESEGEAEWTRQQQLQQQQQAAMVSDTKEVTPQAADKPAAEKPATEKPVDSQPATEKAAAVDKAATPTACCAVAEPTHAEQCVEGCYLRHYALGIGAAIGIVLIGGLLIMRRS